MGHVVKQNGKQPFDKARLRSYIERIMKDYPHLSVDALVKSVLTKLKKDEVTSGEVTRAVYMSAVELISKEEPDWTFVASHGYLTKLYKEAGANRGHKATVEKPYGSFYQLLKQLTTKGIYKKELLEEYSVQDIVKLEQAIDPERDKLFTFIGLLTLTERYLAFDYDKSTLELPQERFMVIALQLMIKEKKEKRIELVKEAYWALSNLYETVATPTLSNSGKAKGGQLSSCFIDIVGDSLRGIYDNNTDIAMLSKLGGGIGIYMGKVRARGSDIRGYLNTSSGTLPWVRQLNNTGISVDQLGTRKGSIAIYLDVWHQDIMDFLDIKLNNGDERMKAHDVFPGVCIPDLFMEAVRDRGDWHLFDPHQVEQLMGWCLEDSYDEKPGEGTFSDRYEQCVYHPLLKRVTVPAIEIMKRIMKSQLETGTPYMFYRDTVNRANPNKHEGMIYSSNLCVEICQNISPTTVEKQEIVTIDGQSKIVITKTPGDFVVCNLASINLAKAVTDGVLERLIPIMVRMLDNVIEINDLSEVPQAQHTNQRYRAVGLGTFGLHHLLALEGIRWESEEAVKYNDQLYEYINFLAIRASMELAKEKGAYPLFKGSEWATGKYFEDRSYESPVWEGLAHNVATYGMRNGYLFAIAPNGSTSIIAGSTASIDPLYQLVTYEEKTTYRIANPAPDLSPKTIWHYKTAHNIDQHWSIKQAAARQRHIDQSQSFNLYVNPEIKAKDLLDLHLDAWSSGLKTTYYVRNQSAEVEDECVVCT